MAPAKGKKTVKMSLQELAAQLVPENDDTALPTQSFGITERERDRRDDSEWGRGGRMERGGMDLPQLDVEDAWRVSKTPASSTTTPAPSSAPSRGGRESLPDPGTAAGPWRSSGRSRVETPGGSAGGSGVPIERKPMSSNLVPPSSTSAVEETNWRKPRDDAAPVKRTTPARPTPLAPSSDAPPTPAAAEPWRPLRVHREVTGTMGGAGSSRFGGGGEGAGVRQMNESRQMTDEAPVDLGSSWRRGGGLGAATTTTTSSSNVPTPAPTSSIRTPGASTARVDSRPEHIRRKYAQKPAGGTTSSTETTTPDPPAPPAESAAAESPPSSAGASVKGEVIKAEKQEAPVSDPAPAPSSPPSSEAPSLRSEGPVKKPVTTGARSAGWGAAAPTPPAPSSSTSGSFPSLGSGADSLPPLGAAPAQPTRAPPRMSALRRRRGGAAVQLESIVEQKLKNAEGGREVPEKKQKDDAKAAYRNKVQEREQRRREEEERKRLEREREASMERRKLEKMMSGNVEKMRVLEDQVKAGFVSRDGVGLLNKMEKLLTDEDLESLVPGIILAKTLVLEILKSNLPPPPSSSNDNNSPSKEGVISDQDRLQRCFDLVESVKPCLQYLFQESKIKNHQLKFLCQTQTVVNALGFPRLSEGLALIEATWDALYMTQTIEETWFLKWHEAIDDDTVGRSDVIYQMLGWFNWLNNASSSAIKAGDTAMTGGEAAEDEEEGGSDEEEEEDLY